MRLVAIESPLAGDFETNRRYALWCAYHCFTLHEASYASHLYYTQFLDDQDESHRVYGMEAGLITAKLCDMRVFYLDLGWSNGMTRAAELVKTESLVAEERWLPSAMLASFRAGELPSATPGF